MNIGRNLADAHEFDHLSVAQLEKSRRLIDDIKHLINGEQQDSLQVQRLKKIIQEKELEVRAAEAALMKKSGVSNRNIDPYVSRIKEGMNQYEDDINNVMASYSNLDSSRESYSEYGGRGHTSNSYDNEQLSDRNSATRFGEQNMF